MKSILWNNAETLICNNLLWIAWSALMHLQVCPCINNPMNSNRHIQDMTLQFLISIKRLRRVKRGKRNQKIRSFRVGSRVRHGLIRDFKKKNRKEKKIGSQACKGRYRIVLVGKTIFNEHFENASFKVLWTK